jgi:hypothetical protein
MTTKKGKNYKVPYKLIRQLPGTVNILSTCFLLVIINGIAFWVSDWSTRTWVEKD